MENKKEEKSFEELLSELESIIKKLDDKDVSLEDAVKNYTLGLDISKKCNEILTKNEEMIIEKMTDTGPEEFKTE